TYTKPNYFLIGITNNLCCRYVRCDEYHVLSNSLQIRVTNLRIKTYIDETFTQPIYMCGVKCTYYEVGRRCEKDPYLNSSTAAVTIPYNPLKFVSPGQNVQNLYYYSHYSGSRTCLMGRSAIAEVASK
ncbi:hypothetical protein ALC56_10683, partial [Trachymyrmex septentrionalis]